LEMIRRQAHSFRPEIPIGAGTDADFYQLNQFRPPLNLCDCICWSMNPQVHAFDNASLAETPESISHQIESAREYFPGKPLAVSPISLKPRFNAVATGPEQRTATGELPPHVDPRQMSLCGAGWTLAMLKRLAEAGVDSVTFYETIGWLGVMETAKGSPLPDRFRSIPNAVFPLYHVLGWVGDFAGGNALPSTSSDPLKVESFVLGSGQTTAMLLANLTGESQRVRVNGLNGKFAMKRLDETNAENAMADPEEFRADKGEKMRAEQGRIEVELKPYGIARLDSRQ
jgi:D-apionolactonase